MYHTQTPTHIHVHTHTHTHTTHDTHTHTHTHTHSHITHHMLIHIMYTVTHTNTQYTTHTHTCLERRGGTTRASLNFLRISEVFVIHRGRAITGLSQSEDLRHLSVCREQEISHREKRDGTQTIVTTRIQAPSRVTRPEFFFGVHPYTF